MQQSQKSTKTHFFGRPPAKVETYEKNDNNFVYLMYRTFE